MGTSDEGWPKLEGDGALRTTDSPELEHDGPAESAGVPREYGAGFLCVLCLRLPAVESMRHPPSAFSLPAFRPLNVQDSGRVLDVQCHPDRRC